MKHLKSFFIMTAAITLSSSLALAADPTAVTETTWHANSLGQAIGYMLLFAFIGIAAAVVGYKIFDKCTPGDLSREILENKNIAAAIVAAAVILGVCLIVAVAMTT
jgi:putative membrane protein